MDTNNKLLKKDYIVLNSSAKNQIDAFKEISTLAFEKNLTSNVDEVTKAFIKREEISTTGFEKGIAIPHAQSEFIKHPAVFVYKFNNPIEWKSVDNTKVKVAIAIILPKDKIVDFQIDILKQISLKLLDADFVKKIKSAQCDKNWIIENLLFKKIDSKLNNKTENLTKTLVAVTGCASGVAHTYMCKELLEKVGPQLGYKVHVECQGQRGKEFDLSQEEIDKADLIIFALDIGIDESMYYGKIVYRVGTHSVVNDAKKVILDAENFKKATLWKQEHKKTKKGWGRGKKAEKESLGAQPDFIQASGKGKPQILKHLLSGCSYLIPFVIFSGISFSIIIGITKGIGGATFTFQGTWTATLQEINKMGLQAHTQALHILFLLNSLVTLGFTFMIPIMGAYIGFSIAGRAALVSTFVTTWVLVNPTLWYDFNGLFDLTNKSTTMDAGASWSLFGAIYAGFMGGYITKGMLKIKVPKWFAPPMAMIVVPVVTTLATMIPVTFLLAAPFGWVMRRMDKGIIWLGSHPQYGWAAGVICGLMIGFDLGGPVNKIAVLVATSLIAPGGDNGQLMGACGAAIPIAPLGSGLTACIFGRKMFNKNERAAGWNALLIGSMGITESSIPFFARDSWRSLIPNMLGSAVAGSLAYVWQTADLVGAWGSFIVAIFGGVQTVRHGSSGGSYIGVIWYCLAIIIGSFVHCGIYTSLLLQKDHLFKKHLLLTINRFKNFKNKFVKLITRKNI